MIRIGKATGYYEKCYVYFVCARSVMKLSKEVNLSFFITF